MKAAANGVLNSARSTAGGTRPGGRLGLAADRLGHRPGRELRRTRSTRTRSRREALYDLLEHDVVPTFYDRGTDGCRASGSRG